jgi:hypothetical protein
VNASRPFETIQLEGQNTIFTEARQTKFSESFLNAVLDVVMVLSLDFFDIISKEDSTATRS